MCVCLLGHSHQPLQGPLLVYFIGAVRDIGVKVGLGVLADYVADVIDYDALLVSFLKLLEESAHRMKKGQCVKDSRRRCQSALHVENEGQPRQEGQRTPLAWTRSEITEEDIPPIKRVRVGH